MKITSLLSAILALCAALLISSSPKAQTIFCPDNIDFEKANLSNWDFFSGNCCPLNANTPGIIINRHTLTNGTNTDPFGNFPVVAPSAGSYSLKLGNSNTGAQSERARYFVQVPGGSGKHILLYRYAIVLQDPNHSPANQPRFVVKAYDSITNAPVPCSEITYVSSSTLPGFVKAPNTNSVVYYKPWTTGTIDLSANAGTTVAIDFSVADCGQGGHFGYAYVDMSCGLYQIEGTICDSVSTQISLNGPQGYQSYEWRDATLTNILGTGQTLTINTPSGPTTFAVILTPYPGFGCQDTLYTTYTSPTYSYVDLTTTNDTSTCIGGQVMIGAIANGPNQPYTFEWFPATGLSCNTCQSPVVTGITNTTYTVIAKNMSGCTDTADININIDTVVQALLTVDKDSICQNESVTVVNLYKKNPPNSIRYWYLQGMGTITSGAGQTDTANIQYPTNGQKRVIFTVSLGLCKSSDTIDVSVGQTLTINLPPDDTICVNGSKQIIVASSTAIGVSYNWVPSASLSCNNCTNPIATPTQNTKYTVYAIDSFGCSGTDEINITIDTPTIADFLISKDSICTNEILGVKNIGLNPAYLQYLWAVDTGNIISGVGTDSINVYWSKPGLKKIRHKTFRGLCETVDSQYVYVIGFPAADFEMPQHACLNAPVKIFPLAGAELYKWAIDENDIPTGPYKNEYGLSWQTTGTKRIKLLVANKHCPDSTEKEINIHSLPFAEIEMDQSTTICEGKEFQLSTLAGDRNTFSWEPAQALNSNNNPVVTAIAERTQRYTLEVTNQWGCSAYDSILVRVESCCDIFMPDAFSPNNDGRNDIYWSPDIDKHTLVKFMIANRRGQIVYDINSPSRGWDGRYKGKEAGQDTYNYYIMYRCNDKEEMIKKGTFVLLR